MLPLKCFPGVFCGNLPATWLWCPSATDSETTLQVDATAFTREKVFGDYAEFIDRNCGGSFGFVLLQSASFVGSSSPPCRWEVRKSAVASSPGATSGGFSLAVCVLQAAVEKRVALCLNFDIAGKQNLFWHLMEPTHWHPRDASQRCMLHSWKDLTFATHE
jgi:hypothetical protein